MKDGAEVVFYAAIVSVFHTEHSMHFSSEQKEAKDQILLFLELV